ncbi:MAG: Hypothetical protein BHV28_03660 [Candidatus Tokpelaia hoelldobleri]|uniref:Uncharacterized protein n=1 Tax=Candidatus Tokpelaia hoelldobleri TaxID=1902579 RepID=A0A1U9JT89_9HYPH|nr:MAG: Hypothetical protein BHV28_03660 [Candidatus Tokpelaia hoelldoblerii]
MGRLIVFAAGAVLGWYVWRAVMRAGGKRPPRKQKTRDTLVHDPETGDYHILSGNKTGQA